MNQTTADSEKIDVVCMSFGKEPQKGLEVVEAGEKDSFLLETMEITVGKSELLENGNLKVENGNNIINFGDYAQLKKNNQTRITDFALEKAKREGKIVDLKTKKTRKQKDTERIV